jgi:hypothetical protein
VTLVAASIRARHDHDAVVFLKYGELETLAAVIGSYTDWATPGPDNP